MHEASDPCPPSIEGKIDPAFARCPDTLHTIELLWLWGKGIRGRRCSAASMPDSVREIR